MLQLYGTDGCHLCHDAQTLLHQLNLNWLDIDIIDDDDLLEQYGTRIPVLRLGHQELNWPFQQEDVLKLVSPADTRIT